MIAGVPLMLEWPVDSLDSLHMVRLNENIFLLENLINSARLTVQFI